MLVLRVIHPPWEFLGENSTVPGTRYPVHGHERWASFRSKTRAQLRLALEGEPAGGESVPLRRGRRIEWVEDALAPLRGRKSEGELRRLVYGIGATLGIEALVWLTDMGGLSREKAVEVMRSNARTLLRSALERLESTG
jgi:hypothetical protein